MPNSQTTTQTDIKDRLSFGEVIDVTLFSFRIYFSMSFWRTTLFIVSRILIDIKRLFNAFIFAKVLDSLINLAKTPNAKLFDLYPFFIAIFLYYAFFDAFVDKLHNICARSLRIMSRTELDKLFYTKIYDLGVMSLENPEVASLIQRGYPQLQTTLDYLREVVVLCARLVTTIASGLVIYSFFPWMIPIIVVLAVIEFVPHSHYIKQDFRWNFINSEPRKIGQHILNFLTTPALLQEIKVTGAYNFLNDKYQNFAKTLNDGYIKIVQKSEITYFFLGILDQAVTLAGYLVVFGDLLKGLITVGTTTFRMSSLDIFSDSISSMSSSISYINEFSIKIYDIARLFKMQPDRVEGAIRMERLKDPPSIEFRDVSFAYPGSEKNIFNHLNLKIDAGEKIAIVGHNGAGKTTLIKLIAGIYQVNSGEILVNGTNINDIKLDDWHKNIGILFQDYNFYGFLTAGQNIYIGRSHKPMNHVKIRQAARNADAIDFIEKYPKGFEQMMSERFRGGIRPSTGQQQKIAIARFFYRNAPLAIFDEPTAAIDAVSEYKIFNKIYKFFKNKTVVIISHRFSTVRNADRIIVMDHGKIVETGSHETLMKKNKIYAKAFKLQAEGYRS